MARHVSDDAGLFVAIPHAFWERGWAARLSPAAIVVYVYLKYRAGATNDAYPSLATIGRESGVSKSTAIRAIGELEGAGLISVSRQKADAGESEVNHYRVLNLTQGVVSNLDDPSSQSDTTGSVKSGPELDTSEQDTSEQDTALAAVSETARRSTKDLLFEAIAEVWKGEPYHAGLLTPAQQSLVGMAAAGLLTINADPADVPVEWARMRESFDNPTPMALVKHWGTRGTGPKIEQNRQVATSWADRQRERHAGLRPVREGDDGVIDVAERRVE